MDEFQMLKIAKKKRGLTVRDFKYQDLEALVHQGLLDKSFPKGKRGLGWPAYKVSRKGARSLAKTYDYLAKQKAR